MWSIYRHGAIELFVLVRRAILPFYPRLVHGAPGDANLLVPGQMTNVASRKNSERQWSLNRPHFEEQSDVPRICHTNAHATRMNIPGMAGMHDIARLATILVEHQGKGEIHEADDRST